MGIIIGKLSSRHLTGCCAMVMLCFLSLQLAGQELIPLEVAKQKAVHLIFSQKVKYCASGSQEVSHTITGNILKLKALKAPFAETNLTVITEDDRLYSFLLLYNENPRRLNLQPAPESGKLLHAPAQPAPAVPGPAAVHTATTASASPTLAAVPATAPAEAYANTCQQILGHWQFEHFIESEGTIYLQLRNIYQDEKYLYFTLCAQNAGDKDLMIDFVNFQQGDAQGILRDVYREGLKKPFYVFNKNEIIKAKGQHHMVYVFEKFSIEAGKKLLIDLGEKNGSRFLSLGIPAKYINEARQLTNK